MISRQQEIIENIHRRAQWVLEELEAERTGIQSHPVMTGSAHQLEVLRGLCQEFLRLPPHD